MEEAPLTPVSKSSPAEPPQPRVRYVLTGGGISVGKAAYSGSEVEFIDFSEKQHETTHWCRMRLLSVPLGHRKSKQQPTVGDELLWSRHWLREVLPSGELTDKAPSRDLLIRSSVLKQPLLPPHMRLPPLLPPMWQGADLTGAEGLVLFDLECSGVSGGSWTITEMAATLVLCLPDGTWGVPEGGRYSTLVARSASFDGAAFCNWLKGASRAAGGCALVMLSHNGNACDWPLLTKALRASGLALPQCVRAMGCSGRLFVAEKKEELGRRWSLHAVHITRFGLRVPNQHEALADVCAMERIFGDVVKHNGSDWTRDAVIDAAERGKTPAQYVAKHDAVYGAPKLAR